MTLTDAPTHRAEADEAQLLFEEARQRRRTRRLIAGVATAVVVVLVVVAVAVAAAGRGGSPSRPTARPAPGPVAAASSVTAGFSLRPVDCYAPAFSPGAGQPPAAGPLPACSAPYQLTASRLGLAPEAGDPSGYSVTQDIGADPQFAAYPSTTRPNDRSHQSVLLPGDPQTGARRFVLGPAALTRTAIASARASEVNGEWAVRLTLTAAGVDQWNTLAQDQFHALIAVVVGGTVVSAPITQPTQTSFSSFGDQVVVGGTFTAHQARVIASELG
jgi:hypothetical protein